ncbi:hypothetical protein GCM10023196_065950 [Actinoallomurus vinaceus]|uniref:Endoglucanase B carbohydrate binding domain-containing protein n=2 Tax=Actinoallomurus vinaceus TaxID=1080074 RepID=A0ABP8UI77_9ACTN
MEAKYGDGTNAGPYTWSSYQQFGNSFAPKYGDNLITLTPEFFNAIHDGARVTLTFRFWSGAAVTYHVTKSGNSVTGTAS